MHISLAADDGKVAMNQLLKRFKFSKKVLSAGPESPVSSMVLAVIYAWMRRIATH